MRALACLVSLLSLGAPAFAAAATPLPISISCAGAFTQGGVALCRSTAGAELLVDGEPRGRFDAEGWAVLGFDRDAPATAIVAARNPDGGEAAIVRAVTTRAWDVQRVDGLPQETVTPSRPETLARIQRDVAAKAAATRSRAEAQGWLAPFDWPLTGRISGRWGNQRVLNGVPRTPHYGVDIAAPTGSEIRAPAPGVVILAEPDMHFEGGLIFLDHGQGLFSYYLHLSRLDVSLGDTVAGGQLLGAVGATGRATGPHLCWRMRWRDRQIDPEQAIEGLRIARQAFAINSDLN